MSNPYEQLESKSFWRPAVSEKSMYDISGLWDPRFQIGPRAKVSTFGSCFAQHIGRSLKERGFNWYIPEAPPLGLGEQHCKTFNYGIFSARTGNLYTTSLLLQWTQWALGLNPVPNEVWEKDGRFYDPFRPKIEPDGFKTEEELVSSRLETIAAFEKCIKDSNFFVFTLGLTESWFNSDGDYEYPMCPGTAAGTYDEALHKFENQNYGKILRSMDQVIGLMRSINPKLKFILTVSPVPLTATNSGQHVLVATMASKSILRAVANELVKTRQCVDYFPSYEIINSPVFRGGFFEPNLRSVNPYGVGFVMDSFFRCLKDKFGEIKQPKKLKQQLSSNEERFDEVCEEEILGAFAAK